MIHTFFYFLFFIPKFRSYYSEEIFKIILSNDINNLDSHSYKFNTKGARLVINPDSQFSIMPIQLATIIEKGFNTYYNSIYDSLHENGNGYYNLKTPIFFEENFPSINIILKKYGIFIPNKYFFEAKEVYYDFIFLISLNMENGDIIIGKDLIDLMQIEIINENEFKINNEEFKIKLND